MDDPTPEAQTVAGPMTPNEVIAACAKGFPDSPEFREAIGDLPPQHWARYDLSAIRLGWELARAAAAAPAEPVVCHMRLECSPEERCPGPRCIAAPKA